MINDNTVVAYDGLSQYTRQRILMFLTNLRRRSRNPKTGDMLQTYIVAAESHPIEALRTGADRHVCGGCPLRAGACYVTVANAPTQLWRSWQAGRILPADVATLSDLTAGRYLRLGSYGDPAAVPWPIWEALLRDVRGWTGYTHAWASPRFQYLRKYCMASVDTDAQRERATAMGWSTFQVRPQGDPKRVRTQSICPASAEAGHRLTCQQCKRCNGAQARQRHVVIQAHGAKARRFLEVQRA